LLPLQSVPIKKITIFSHICPTSSRKAWNIFDITFKSSNIDSLDKTDRKCLDKADGKCLDTLDWYGLEREKSGASWP
jgi:hypothetical protein